MRVCLFRLSALGDVVLTLPTVRTLLREIPNIELTWVIGKEAYPLVKDLKGVSFLPLEKPKSVASFFRERRRLKSLGHFDYLLAMQASMSAHLLYPSISAKVKIGYDKTRSKDFHRFFINCSVSYREEHLLDGFLRFAEALGAKRFHYEGEVPISLEAKERVLDKLPKEPFFVLSPMASKKERMWPLDQNAGLIREVQKRWGIVAVITGGKGDQKGCQKLAEMSGGKNLAGKLSLQELAATIAKAQFVVTPDSGPSHIASGLKVPTIGLYVAMTPRLTGPYFHQDLVVDSYERALEHYHLPIRTKKGAFTRIHREGMMKLISLDAVLEKIAILLEGDFNEESNREHSCLASHHVNQSLKVDAPLHE